MPACCYEELPSLHSHSGFYSPLCLLQVIDLTADCFDLIVTSMELTVAYLSHWLSPQSCLGKLSWLLLMMGFTGNSFSQSEDWWLNNFYFHPFCDLEFCCCSRLQIRPDVCLRIPPSLHPDIFHHLHHPLWIGNCPKRRICMMRTVGAKTDRLVVVQTQLSSVLPQLQLQGWVSVMTILVQWLAQPRLWPINLNVKCCCEWFDRQIWGLWCQSSSGKWVRV